MESFDTVSQEFVFHAVPQRSRNEEAEAGQAPELYTTFLLRLVRVFIQHFKLYSETVHSLILFSCFHGLAELKSKKDAFNVRFPREASCLKEEYHWHQS